MVARPLACLACLWEEEGGVGKDLADQFYRRINVNVNGLQYIINLPDIPEWLASPTSF